MAYINTKKLKEEVTLTKLFRKGLKELMENTMGNRHNVDKLEEVKCKMWDFISKNNRNPNIVIMHPANYNSLIECIGMRSGFFSLPLRIWGVKILRSQDVLENQILVY